MSLPPFKNTAPNVLAVREIAKTRLFRIEEVDLCFSNGEQRTYERVKGQRQGAVLVVPITSDGHMILVREYATGLDQYELTFPKGIIDPGETSEEAAQRELQEEAGYRADKFTFLKRVATSPAYMSNTLDFFLAEGLSSSILVGDEPEPLEKVYWSLSNYPALLGSEHFNGALSLSALLLTLEKINVR